MNSQLLPAAEPLTLPMPALPRIRFAELSEDEVLQRAAEYDQQALSEVYDRYETKIHAFMYRRTGDRALAEDLTAQVFLKVLEAIRSRRIWHSSFSGWIYRIAHNLLVDHYRDCAKQSVVPLDEAPFLATGHDNPVAVAERSLECDRLRSAIIRLTDDQAMVITLRFLERYSINEVARMLDKTEGAVKALQHRALATLFQLLENEEIWES